MVNHSQIEQYKKEMEERAGQEIRQKLQEVNLFLQVNEFVVYVCSLYYETFFLSFFVHILILCVSAVLLSFLKRSGRTENGWAEVLSCV